MIDKSTIQQVLGGLYKNPTFINQSDKYQLDVTDFSSLFEKYLFTAIINLHKKGAKKINMIDVENFFETDDRAKQIFKNNNGLDYLHSLEEFTSEENFDYYYAKLKKLNILRDYKKIGFDISDFYAEDLTAKDAFKINEKFESLTINNIVEETRRKFLKIEDKYLKSDSTEIEKASNNIENLIQSFKDKVDVGLPVQGFFTNEVLGGARRGTLCIRSAASGTGKTRQAVGDACYLAFPVRYDSKTCEWIKTGSCEKVLFIATEQNADEIRRMILAYLTDMNESCFRYGEFSEREEKLLQEAVQVIKEFEDNFLIVRMPSPTIELVKHIIRENCIMNDIYYVFYDYIFISPSLLNEFKHANLRNDELLLMFASALKDLAVELNAFIMTSTQVNANIDDNKNIRNESSLAGGRATINKADYGLITARPTKEELEILQELSDKYGEPNAVTDVFKVRSGAWTQVRIWAHIDLGTLKKEELFVTNSRLEMIQDFTADFNYGIQGLKKEDKQRVEKFLEKLNKKVVFDI